MDLCQIYKLEILKFMFKYKNKTLPNYCFKTYFTTPSETNNIIIIRPGLLLMTTALLHSNINSPLQNVQSYIIWNDLPLEIKKLQKKSYFIFLK